MNIIIIEDLYKVDCRYLYAAFHPLELHHTTRKHKRQTNGYIQEVGWLIRYCFGKDINGEYLDYYVAKSNDSFNYSKRSSANINLQFKIINKY